MAWFRWLPRASSAPPLALALQGGGAHGAFTWGVLDALLESTDWPIESISGTSAGALNAVALAHGWMQGGRAGARAALERLWLAVGAHSPFDLLGTNGAAPPGLADGVRAALSWMRLFSPYQFNPLGLDPLRELLAAQFDFDALRRHGRIRLFVAATHANSGRLRLFDERELTLDALLASACLPALQHAVAIDGEPYWDGGYSANPALFPLTRGLARDLLVVTLLPHAFEHAPRSARQIGERALEFAFGAVYRREAALLAEAIAHARAARWPRGRIERRLSRLRTHRIDADAELGALAPETRLSAHGPFLERLRDLGRERARRWLDEHGASVGVRASADLGSAPPARDKDIAAA
jgi:NTE family protein